MVFSCPSNRLHVSYMMRGGLTARWPTGWLAPIRLSVDRAALMTSCRPLGDVRTRGRLAQLNQLGDGSSSATTGGGGRVAGLTERELQVLTLAAQGASNPEIAKTPRFSVSTIRNDMISICRKFDEGMRASAVAAAILLGVLAMDEIA